MGGGGGHVIRREMDEKESLGVRGNEMRGGRCVVKRVEYGCRGVFIIKWVDDFRGCDILLLLSQELVFLLFDSGRCSVCVTLVSIAS